MPFVCVFINCAALLRGGRGGGRCPAHSASQFSRMGAGLDKRVEISAPNDGTTYHQWGFDEPVGQMKFHTVQ